MSELKWGLITNGATFEALVLTLVRFEDPKASLFARRGPDGGQDARSGDGTTVYQAKHHTDGSAAKAIADALDESSKVESYRRDEHPRAKQWQGVTHWRLVCNAEFNPRDRQRWLDEVVPAFAQQGLTADFWQRADLESLLAKHPEVYRSFFEQEARAFLTLPEVRERFEQDEPFLTRDALTPFVGREQETSEIEAFLASTELFLVVHGSGGIGKSRFLLEVGERLADIGDWQVLWANVATLSAGTSWFDGVVPERPTVLFVDEPDSEQVLRLLSEQLGGYVGRASKWKVVVAVRSPKDPVLRFLSTPKLNARVRWLPLKELTKEAARKMCRDLLATGPRAREVASWREHAIESLADRFARQPIWMTLAVHLLETYGDVNRIPETASALAELYLNEVIEQQRGDDPDTIRNCLRWVALIGTINRESDSIVQLVADQSGIKDVTTMRGLLARLVDRRALSQRGANGRFVELKPDVLRDHILTAWLAVSVGFGSSPYAASPDVAALLKPITTAIEKGGLSDVGRAILSSIARTEVLFRRLEQPVALLDPFFRVLVGALPRLTASGRIALAQVLPDVARFRVSEVVALTERLRTSPVATETIETMYGRRELTQDDVLLSLAWPVYHAAMGAETLQQQVAVLTSLYELAIAEAEAVPRLPRRELPNDGRRAGTLVGQTIAGGLYFWSSFNDASSQLGMAKLETLRSQPPSPAETRALKALMIPLLAVERHEDWVEGDQFIFRKYVIGEGHPAWTTREGLIAKVKELLLDDSVTLDSQLVLWELFVEAHRLANFVALHEPNEFARKTRARFMEDLQWTRDVLTRRGLRFEEMRAARDIWDWHARFDKDTELKAAAEELETLYTKNELAAEFEPLLEFESVEAYDRNAMIAAQRIVAAGDHGIRTFVERGVLFVKEDRRFFTLLGVGSQLGSLARGNARVRTFVTETLAKHEERHLLEFTLSVASRWLFDTRREDGGPKAFELLQALLGLCGDELTQIELLSAVYGLAPPRYKSEELSEPEHTFLRRQGEMFARHAREPAFVALVSPAFMHDGAAYRMLLEQSFDRLAEPVLTHAVAALVQGVFWAVYDRQGVDAPGGFSEWLLDQVIRVADLDGLGSMNDHRLGEVLAAVGRAPLRWLPKALKARAALESSQGYGKVLAIGHQSSLGEYVEPIGEGEPDRQQVAGVIDELLDLADDPGTVGYRLNDILHDVDPHGVVLADAIAARIRSVGPDDVMRFVRLARSYVVDTPPWRTIALPVLQIAASPEKSDERNVLFSALGDPGIRTWSGKHGEVASVFVNALDTARRHRDNEKDPRFAAFWNWYVEVAAAELEREKESAKEERGE